MAKFQAPKLKINNKLLNNAVNEIFTVLAPPSNLTISQWADQFRKLSPEASAEPGQWRTNRTEYLRGIMDAFSDPSVHTVVVKSSAQVGKTEVVNNIVGYHIHQDPCPMLIIQPTVEMGQTWSKDRLAPMVRDTEVLKNKFTDFKGRDASNTMMHKIFKGGHLTIVGANAPSGLASRPIRLVLGDEVDRYPVSAGTEGDPIELAKVRQKTFWNRKTGLVSTPTIKGYSRIDKAYEEGDQRKYYVPCPHCGFKQALRWENVKFQNRDPETARYACDDCGVLWTDAQRWASIKKGVWVAHSDFKGTASFHLSEIYSPWVKLSEMVDKFLIVKNDPERLKTWVNTSLGETYEESGEGVEADVLMLRRENYTKVPDGVAVLTAGVDVQDDRLELEVVGWGFGNESWSIAYKIFYGNPALETIWNELDTFLKGKFEHENGFNLNIAATCIDSGGHYTNEVYAFCKPRQYKRIYAVKGSSQSGKPIIGRHSKNNKGRVMLFPVGTDTAKERIYSYLKVSEPGEAYCHFSTNVNDEEYFKQLTVEKVVTRYTMGRPQRVWKKPDGARNEALDCRVYATAALEILNPNYAAILDKQTEMPVNSNDESDVEKALIDRRPSKKRKRTGFVNRWKP